MGFLKNLSNRIVTGIIRVASRPLARIKKFIKNMENTLSNWGATRQQIKENRKHLKEGIDVVGKQLTWATLGRDEIPPEYLFVPTMANIAQRYAYIGLAQLWLGELDISRTENRTLLYDKRITKNEVEEILQDHLPHTEGSHQNIVLTFDVTHGLRGVR